MADQGNLKCALKEATEAIKLYPTYGDSYFVRAATHNKLGDTTSAQRDRKKAIELNPSFEKRAYPENFDRDWLGKLTF